jgi:hypothetical protein
MNAVQELNIKEQINFDVLIKKSSK